MTGRRRWTSAGAVIVALGLVAAGCGDDSPPSSTTTSAGATSSTSGPATTAAPTPSSTAATSPTTSPAPPIVVDDVAVGIETDRYSVKLTLPRMQGLADAAVQDAVNADIRAAVDAAVEEFASGVSEIGSTAPDMKSSLVATYEVARVDDALSSILVEVSRYFAPQPHPARALLTFTHDLHTGKRLALADLFNPGAPYLETLSEQSRQLLAAQPGFDQLTGFTTGTEPKAENFAAWTLTDQDLVITFAEYQVAPYALGTPHVSIPFASLRTLLDPNGPLAIHN